MEVAFQESGLKLGVENRLAGDASSGRKCCWGALVAMQAFGERAGTTFGNCN